MTHDIADHSPLQRAQGSPRRRHARRALVACVSIGGLLIGANAAAADSIKYESYQRASQSEECAAQPGETVWQASWGADSSWGPTWEQWANGGNGGWTCTRSMTWARTPVASGGGGVVSGGGGSVSYAVGDIGPGGGLVFLISGGLTYEMAPKTWSGADDPALTWCDGPTNTPAASGTAVGTGSANTAAMAASGACSSNAAAAVLAYAPTGTNAGEWFLPSQDELNAMCNYSRNPASPSAPSVACSGSQDSTFSTSAYGFTAVLDYFSSTQDSGGGGRIAAWSQSLSFMFATQVPSPKFLARSVRPVRAF